MLRRLVLWLLLAGVPCAVSQAAVSTLFGRALTDSVAYAPNDELAYWNQIATFERAGFSGGYTTVEERPSPAAFSHFGPHGPTFAMLYGSAARLAGGWRYASGPLFGLVAIVAGAAVFSTLVEAPLLAAALLVGTFWPLAIALPHTMQEPLHYAFAFVLAGLTVRVLATDTPGAAILVVTAVVLSLTSLVRPVWALLAIPLGWHLGRRRGARGAWSGAAAGAIFAAAAYVAFMALAAPYPYSSRLLAGLREAPVRALAGLADHMVREAPREWFSPRALPLELVVRCELLLVGGVAWLLSRRAADVADRRRFACVATVAVLLVAAVLAVGEIGTLRDYRTITPVLLMLLLIGLTTRTRMIWGLVVLQLAAAGAALDVFRNEHEERFAKARVADIDSFAASIAAHIRFDPSISAWGNTLLIKVDRYTYLLLGLPHGIGASAVIDWDRLTLPPRSRYLLLGPDDRAQLGARVHLRRLTSTPLGELYENEEWQR